MSTSEMQATPQDDTSATSEELDEIRDLIGKIMLWGFNVTGLRRPTEILLAGAMISELRAIKAAAITSDRQQRDAQHAAEVAQVRRDIRLEDAAALCIGCRGRLAHIATPGGVGHMSGNQVVRCPAAPIHALIAEEAARA